MRSSLTAAAKAGAEKEAGYRSAEALRHPTSSATASFSAACEAVSVQNGFVRRLLGETLPKYQITRS